MTTHKQSRSHLLPLDARKQLLWLTMYLSTCFSSRALRSRGPCFSFLTRFSCLTFQARLTFRTLKKRSVSGFKSLTVIFSGYLPKVHENQRDQLDQLHQ